MLIYKSIHQGWLALVLGSAPLRSHAARQPTCVRVTTPSHHPQQLVNKIGGGGGVFLSFRG
jgi:hypothetical protein